MSGRLSVIDAPVLLQREGCAGRIRFFGRDGPAKLQPEVYQSILRALTKWAGDPSIKTVLIDHNERGSGFCSGMDLELLARFARRNDRKAHGYLRLSYALSQLIAGFPKPIIAFLDGPVTGTGVALSSLATHQIATERTTMAITDTLYGLVPHGGTTWVLPRLKGEIGTWLALTGTRLNGHEVLATRLASHFCPADVLDALKADLTRRGADALTPFATEGRGPFQHLFPKIKSLFDGDNIKDIVRRLDGGDDWAKQQATRIKAKSALSSRIALRQIRTGAFLESVADALRIEYRITSRLVQTRNFHEGVRAALIDRDYCPRWSPDSVYDVSFDMVAPFFQPLDQNEYKVASACLRS